MHQLWPLCRRNRPGWIQLNHLYVISWEHVQLFLPPSFSWRSLRTRTSSDIILHTFLYTTAFSQGYLYISWTWHTTLYRKKGTTPLSSTPLISVLFLLSASRVFSKGQTITKFPNMTFSSWKLLLYCQDYQDVRQVKLKTSPKLLLWQNECA